MADQRQSMPPEEFAREFLSWWDDPVSVGGALSLDAWLTLADALAPRGDAPVYGVDLGEDRMASIGAAWQRADGCAHLLLTADEAGKLDTNLTAREVVDRLTVITARFPGTVALGGPALDLEDDLAAAGIPVERVLPTEFAHGCGQVADGVRDRTIRHGNQEPLNAAVRAARWRNVGTTGAREFKLAGCPEIGPLAAVTRASYVVNVKAEAGGWMVGL